LLFRWYNTSNETAELNFRSEIPHQHFYKTTILEARENPISSNTAGGLSLLTGPCEIVTIGIQR
ncbi:MAG TPA: glycosyl hydrolase-related protein, partial [Paenibacillus sp.]